MAMLTIELPDDEIADLGKTSAEASETMRLAAAFQLCSEGRISTSKAARLAGLSYADFLTAATDHRVELHRYEVDELREELSRPPNGAIDTVKEELRRAQPDCG
jgi:predicted HTH domain antitoxin